MSTQLYFLSLQIMQTLVCNPVSWYVKHHFNFIRTNGWQPWPKYIFGKLTESPIFIGLTRSRRE